MLALLVSGGHTELVLMKKWFKYEVIGKTLDDAVGEAFDKVARMLGLPYPGGPAISALAESGRSKSQKSNFKLPSLYALRGKNLTEDEKNAFAAEFEDAIADVMVSKTRKALWDSGAQTFVIGGGVAANRYLRKKLEALVLEEFHDVDLRLPELSITGDNAIMIAQAALARALSGLNDAAGPELRAVGNLSIDKRA
ncbi:MAG: putative tRNA threonylcarbamoyladenosine biosynthesis protein Gcp [Parcubacteria group bacterium GW2011_GWA1_47_11]|nr:MAG: putative tRNA threonylcarbamoyladenosine biosynthesis protein Gcp [Parcubacteria group bacterium GW2011_GWA1_47_11]